MPRTLVLLTALVAVLALGIVPLRAQTHGIDVSKYQGNINWTKVAKSKEAKFVYVKATEGMSIQDQYYKRNIDGARAAGLLVGSYHLYSSKTTAEQQFSNFKRMVKKDQQDLIPVLDIEAVHGRNLNVKRVDRILELMESEYGARPIIYTSESVYFSYFASSKYKNYQIFIADYRGYPKARFTLWQYTQTGRISGISGNVDISELHSTKTVNDLMLVKKKAKKGKADKKGGLQSDPDAGAADPANPNSEDD